MLYQFLRKREGGEGVDLDLEEAAASLAPTTVEDGGVPGSRGPVPGAPPVPGTPPASRSRSRPSRARNPGGSKGRKKGGAAANKPAAAVIPNTTSQADSFAGGSYPQVPGQVNPNMMGSFNAYQPPPPQPGQYQPPFSSMPHHYPDSNNSYGHGGYGSGDFSGSSMPMSGQGSFPNANVGYGESVAPPSSSFGSSTQQMFPSSNPSPSTPSSSQGYDSMNTSYFSGNSNSSGQHGQHGNFQSPAGYDQSWSGGSSNYNFNQAQQGSQSFAGQNYSQGGSFQGYNPPPAGTQGFSQNMYSAPSGSSSSSSATGSSGANGTGSSGGSSAAPSASSSGYQQPGLLGQPPQQQNNQQQGMMMGNQGMMHGQQQPRMNAAANMMIPPSPVNSSGMLPGGAPSLVPPPRRANPPFIQQSPINASGMLPGGAPTKDLMMPGKNPGMGRPGMAGDMGPRGNMMGNMNNRMMPMNSGMGGMGPGMGPDGMMPHHGQGMGMYSSQGMMGNEPLPSMGGSDAPTAEDLLRSETEDFAPFDSSVDMMSGMNKKTDMYGIKSDSSRLFDPWANSHNQGYGMANSYKQEENMNSYKQEESMNSYTDFKSAISKMKNDRDEKYNMDPGPLPELKSDMVDLKSKENMDSMKGLDSDDGKWQMDSMEMMDKDKAEGEVKRKEDGKEEEDDEPILGPDGKPAIEVTGPGKIPANAREDPGIPYDWVSKT